MKYGNWPPVNDYMHSSYILGMSKDYYHLSLSKCEYAYTLWISKTRIGHAIP